MIGRSADDAAERKKELRKIGWALLAALMVHLVVGYAIAVSQGLFSSTLPVIEDKPMELTLVDLPATPPQAPPKKNSVFIDQDESKQSAEAPKDKTFESNVNSVAASQQPATGQFPLPSQEGKERPFVDMESHSYSLPIEGAQPQPSAAPKESASPAPSVQPTSTPLPDQLAMLRPSPSVRPSPATKPQAPSSAYRPLKEQTRIAGSISNRGISSVNALGTPLGRYEKIMKDAIGSRWYSYMESKGENTSIGTIQVHFFIDRSGKVKNLKITQNTSNEAFANICLQSILDAHFPPIPEDLAATLPSEGLELEEFTFIIYPN